MCMIKPAKEHNILCFDSEFIWKERSATMNELTKEYLLLFDTILKTQQTLQNLQENLVQAQQMAEELYLERTDEPAA